MRLISLDYIRPLPRRRTASLVLLTLASVFTIYLWHAYQEINTSTEFLEAKIATQPRYQTEPKMNNLQPSSESQTTQIETTHVQHVMSQLSLPWEKIFDTLEDNSTSNVALLSITPNADQRSISLHGEAVNLDALLIYIEKLQNTKFLTSVYLLNHQIQTQDPKKPILFQIITQWAEH